MLDPGAPFAFFSRHEALTVAAAAARIFPTDELGPGANEAGVVYYVDRALAGHDRDLQDTYRRGVVLLDRLAGAPGEPPFHRLLPERQDQILARLEAGADVPEGPEAGAPRHPEGTRAEAGPGAPPSGPFASVFFQALVNHTREGMFSDPVHGGNRGMVGWRLLGHPGVQLVYTEEDFRHGAAIDRPPRPLSDFLSERGDV